MAHRLRQRRWTRMVWLLVSTAALTAGPMLIVSVWRCFDQASLIGQIEELGGRARRSSIWISPLRWVETYVPDKWKPGLEQVHSVEWTHVTRERIELTERLRTVDFLNLSYSDVTDEELALLLGLKNLRILRLDATGITDEGLRHVGRLTRLTHFSASSTGLTDVGLSHLWNLSNLRNVDLESTWVTPNGIAELRRRLPRCRCYL